MNYLITFILTTTNAISENVPSSGTKWHAIMAYIHPLNYTSYNALYHFDELPIDPIKIVCLQQEKWKSGGKTFDILCLGKQILVFIKKTFKHPFHAQINS
jgi:hypothetical protein